MGTDAPVMGPRSERDPRLQVAPAKLAAKFFSFTQNNFSKTYWYLVDIYTVCKAARDRF